MKDFVVDDSPLIRERLKELLEELPGIKLIGQTARSSGTVEVILAAKPDVVILDIQLPKGSGINILKNLELIEKPLVKIMLTAFPNPLYRRRCLEAGADYFLEKILDLNLLVKVIADLAGKQANPQYNNNKRNRILKGQGGLGT